MKKIAKKIHSFILDTLFPVHCLNCNLEGVWICETCQSKIKILTEHVCGICEKKIVPDGRTCHECKKNSSLDGLIPATKYNEVWISHATHLFKYRFAKDLHQPLANLAIKALQKTDIALPDIIIPIPLHAKRLRWRGFNQSALIAKHIAKNLLPQNELFLQENILIRNRNTSPQMQIKDFHGRKQNISGAFSVTDTELIHNKTVLLVDDIATTGSTILECAKVLKNAGAKEVFAVVIARQETKK